MSYCSLSTKTSGTSILFIVRNFLGKTTCHVSLSPCLIRTYTFIYYKIVFQWLLQIVKRRNHNFIYQLPFMRMTHLTKFEIILSGKVLIFHYVIKSITLFTNSFYIHNNQTLKITHWCDKNVSNYKYKFYVSLNKLKILRLFILKKIISEVEHKLN